MESHKTCSKPPSSVAHTQCLLVKRYEFTSHPVTQIWRFDETKTPQLRHPGCFHEELVQMKSLGPQNVKICENHAIPQYILYPSVI